jgi:nucleotide-binding universal stress UspA family protein
MRQSALDSDPAPQADRRPVFASILCGVDGSRQSAEAARQAAILATDGATLSLLAVTWEAGAGPTATAVLSPRRALEALERARIAARRLGLRPEVEAVGASDASARLLEAARDHDLLVLGVSKRSRLGGILIGRTAAAALHRSPVPVLVARRPPAAPFPSSILLATDGSATSRSAAELATTLARRHDARLTVVSGAARDAARPRGKPHLAIARAADEIGASLVITGSRGPAGLSALRSVSERVGECARCSVLVVRPHV